MNTTDKPGGEAGESPHIWLRYATQFTTGGRTHTIEMGIPVPLGATAEIRAKLIREAQAGMDQLASHVENRVTQMLQRNQRPQSTTPAPSIPPFAASPTSKSVGGTSPAGTAPAGQSVRTGTPATPQESQKGTEVVVPPTRTQVGASLPLAPGLVGEANSILSLTQFLRVIKGTWGLSHQQAKDLLQVDKLEGLNLRDALERLQHLMAQKSASSAVANQKPQGSEQPKPVQRPSSPSPTPLPSASTRPTPIPAPTPTASRAPGPIPVPQPAKPSPAQSPPAISAKPPINLNTRTAVNEKQSPYKFDEEDEDEEMIFDDGDEDEEHPALSAEQRLRAGDIIGKMRDVHGSSAASPGRLTVLHNITSTQISEEQLQELMQGFWKTTSSKKLKADQVEELISWAKEDEFSEEVEAVLMLLEEE
jgi:hypothetical protein